MRILSYVKSLDGCSYHRIFQQNTYTSHEVRHVNNLTEADIAWCDILNYSRHCVYAPEFLKEMKAKHNFKVVVDTDDHWWVPKWHPHYEYWKDGLLSKQIEKHLWFADAVTVTHGRLAALVPNDNVHILPNTIPYGDGQYAIREPRTSDKVRLLYASTAMNYINVDLLSRVMKKLAKLPIEVVIAGGTKSKYFDKIVYLLTDNGRIQNKIIPFAPIDDYMKSYEGDILLLPSKESEFNSMKSNLKLLEAGALSIPVVCSPHDPYKDFPISYAHGENEWVEKITNLVEDKIFRIHCGQQLNKFCTEKYNMKTRDHIYELI